MTRTFHLRPAWTPLNILLMVLGFVFFWPLGLAMIAYILWGERLEVAFNGSHRRWHDHGWWNETWCGPGARHERHAHQHENREHRAHTRSGATGNAAFDEYRDRELNRLEEERRKLDEMRAQFDDFLTNLRKARDQEEFDRFARGRNGSHETGGPARDDHGV